MAAVKERLDKHDKQIASMRNLMKGGIDMVLEIRRLTLETRKDLRALAASQKRTDASLHALIDSRGWVETVKARRGSICRVGNGRLRSHQS